MAWAKTDIIRPGEKTADQLKLELITAKLDLLIIKLEKIIEELD